jgi:sarcosine oxidase subunit gamma
MIKKGKNKMHQISEKGAFVDVKLLKPFSAISIRLDHSNAKIRKKLKKTLGQEVPLQEVATINGNIYLCWISDDELLFIDEKNENKNLLPKILKEFRTIHSMVESVTDMRAWFSIKGAGAINLLRKGVPIDLSRLDLSSKNFFRTCLGEIQVNILIKSHDQVIICVLRSCEGYASNWLEHCSRKGSEVKFDL